METGFAAADSRDDYARARRNATLARLAARLRMRSGDLDVLLPFDEVVTALGRRGETYLGEQLVDLDAIVGSVDRTKGFDRRFRPTSPQSRVRFERIAAASRRARCCRRWTSTGSGRCTSCGTATTASRSPARSAARSSPPGSSWCTPRSEPGWGSRWPTCRSRAKSGCSPSGSRCRRPCARGSCCGTRTTTPCSPRGSRRGASGATRSAASWVTGPPPHWRGSPRSTSRCSTRCAMPAGRQVHRRGAEAGDEQVGRVVVEVARDVDLLRSARGPARPPRPPGRPPHRRPWPAAAGRPCSRAPTGAGRARSSGRPWPGRGPSAHGR